MKVYIVITIEGGIAYFGDAFANKPEADSFFVDCVNELKANEEDNPTCLRWAQSLDGENEVRMWEGTL
jgi:hypothetical protein